MIDPGTIKTLSLEEEILQAYTSDQLDDLFRRHFQTFLQETPSLYRDWNLNPKAFGGLSIRKREIVRLLGIVFSEEVLFAQWLQRLPYMVSKVLETVIWEGKQEIGFLDQRTKGNIRFKISANELELETLNPEYCLFFISKLEGEKLKGESYYYLDLPRTLRKKLKAFYPKPSGYELKALKSPRETTITFCDQQRILSLLPLLLDYIEQGNLQQTKSGKPRKTSLNQLLKYTELEEFYLDTSDPAFKTLRLELILFLCLFFNQNKENGDSISLLKAMLLCFKKSEEHPLIPLMDHLKGWYHAASALKNTQAVLMDLLAQLPAGGWVSIKQLLRFLKLHDLESIPIDESSACETLYLTMDWQGWGHTKKYVTPDIYGKVIQEPLLKSALMLFGALGLLDLKLNKPVPDPDLEKYHQSALTVFDGLSYVRLTPLGVYCCGLRADLPDERPQGEKTEVLLDEDRLIVCLSQHHPAIEMKLQKLARRIGARLYRVDADSFLSGCSELSELNARILLLKELVTSPVPVLWENFFNDLRVKTNLFEIQDEVIVIKLKSADNLLFDLVTNDPEIRRLVLLVEDYQIVVKQKDIDVLRDRLRFFGYLF